MSFEAGKIQTYVGTGEAGYAGDGGPALQAVCTEPFMCDFDSAGNLFYSESRNNIIRRVDKVTGIITTVAGTGEPGYSGDGGPGPQAQMREPNDCWLDGKGGLLIADIQDQRVRRLDLVTGIINTFAGDGEKRRTGDGKPAAEASLMGPRAVCMDTKGNTYIAEREGNGVRKVDANGVMSTFAGTGEPGYTGDGGPALTATWGAPKAMRCDNHDDLIVVDTENNAVRRIDVKTGIVTTVAGGHQGGGGDGGYATDAGLERPHGLGIDRQGNLYIADGINRRVRVVGMR